MLRIMWVAMVALCAVAVGLPQVSAATLTQAQKETIGRQVVRPGVYEMPAYKELLEDGLRIATAGRTI